MADMLDQQLEYIENFISKTLLMFQNKRKWIMRGIIAILFVMAITGGCSYLNKRFNVEDDNIIEETVEKIIEKQTGLDLDLTPNSKEDHLFHKCS